jgi:hypothetical protein
MFWHDPDSACCSGPVTVIREITTGHPDVEVEMEVHRIGQPAMDTFNVLSRELSDICECDDCAHTGMGMEGRSWPCDAAATERLWNVDHPEEESHFCNVCAGEAYRSNNWWTDEEKAEWAS